MKIQFCSIDARDNYYCGYNTIGLSDDEEKGPVEIFNKQNAVVMIQAEREYLTELKKLQTRIARKYKALLDHSNADAPKEHDYSHALNKEEYNKAEQEAKKLFKGSLADFYT